MITQELLFSDKEKTFLNKEDLDTTKFILSLFDTDDLDISEALNYLKNYINPNTAFDELALRWTAYNFQFSKEKEDTIICDLGFDNVYCKLVNHSVLGYYALLKNYMPPYRDDWKLKQISTFNPIGQYCDEKHYWISGQNIELEWAESARILTTIICNEFDRSIAAINKCLNKKLNKDNLELFFDIEEFKVSSGHDDINELKRYLL